nr:chemotaxis protein CheX [Kofleriaceae bacterium]
MTTTMLGKRFSPTNTRPPSLWRTAVLPIPGARPVMVALSSDRPGCAALAAAMLMADENTIGDPEIDDFLRELLNMAAGQIKRELALDQALGLPRVVDGGVMFDTHPWSHHVLDSGPIHLVVSLSDAIY